MLRKLLRYDLKSLFKSVFPLYTYGLIIAIICGVINRINEASAAWIWSFLGSIVVLAEYAIYIFLIVYPIIVIIKRYVDNMYGDEGYLTHTLPIKKEKILLSKYISGFILLVVSVALIFVFYAIANYTLYYLEHYTSSFYASIEDLARLLEIGEFKLISILVLFISIAFIAFQAVIYAAISVGNSFDTKKKSHIFAMGVIFYLAMELLLVMAVVIASIFNKDIVAVLTERIPINYNVFINIIIATSISYIISIIGMYFVTKRYLNKKTNLE